MASPSSSPSPLETDPYHPFAHTKALLEIIPDKIDVEEESRLYDDLCVRNTIIPFLHSDHQHYPGFHRTRSMIPDNHLTNHINLAVNVLYQYTPETPNPNRSG